MIAPVLDYIRPISIRSGAVLGTKTLAEIRADVENTTFPSHVKPTPKNLGQTSHGQLSAKEWITTCTISLAITLPRLWLHQREVDPRLQDMLEHFAQLVALVKITSRYSVTQEHTHDADEFAMRYLQDIPRLYPATSIHPTHHLICHVGQILRDIGPGFSWSAWAFEFLNGLAQHIPTNWKIGELFLLATIWRKTHADAVSVKGNWKRLFLRRWTVRRSCALCF